MGKKDARGDIRMEKKYKMAMKALGISPQIIVDNWIKRNMKKLLPFIKEK